MLTPTLPDWKATLQKKASQLQSSAKNVEQVFFEQAYIFIQNAAEPLMKPEFRVGFEVVYHNDDNTRLAGIFVFRVGTTLLYAPVFYLNGQIRGHELLHRTDTKTFVLLDPDWCKYLIASYSVEAGKGEPRTDLKDRVTRATHLDKLISPPGTYKQAATQFWNDLTASADALTSGSLQGEEKQAALRMRECIVDLGVDALDLIKQASDASYTLENNLYLAFDPDLYLPLEALEKKAATADGLEADQLIIYPEPATNPLCKSASETDIRNGYQVVDTRTEKQAKIVVNGTTHATTVTFGQPQRVMYHDGKARDTYAVHTAYRLADPEDSHEMPSTEREYGVFEGGAFYTIPCDHKNATFIVDNTATVETLETKAKDAPSAGGIYYLYFPNRHTISTERYRARKKGKVYQLYTYYHYQDEGEEWPTEDDSVTPAYTFNPNAQATNARARIIGQDAKFLPAPKKRVEAKDAPFPMSGTDFRDLMYKEGTYTVAARLNQDGQSLQVKVANKTPRNFASIHGAAIAVAAATGLPVDDAYEVFDGLADGRQTEAYVKSARLHWDEVPDFLDSFDPSFGVATESPQSFQVSAKYPDTHREPPRIGDKTEITTGEDIDRFGGPAQLDAFAKQIGMRQIMAHGVIGSLLQEFDVANAIDKYLPDLERGLDRLGRLLFLIYWKPDDFGRLFGMDDISVMESSIGGAFKQQARLLLDLLQKAKEPKTSKTDAG